MGLGAFWGFYSLFAIPHKSNRLIMKYTLAIALLFAVVETGFAQQVNPFEKTFNFMEYASDGGTRIFADSNGYLITVGALCFGNQLRCSAMLKTDWNGEELWRSDIFHTYPNGFAITDALRHIDNDNTYLVVGSAWEDTAQSYKPFVMKISAEGDSLWVRDFDDPNKDTANKLEALSDGNYLMDIVGGIYNQFSEIILQKITPEGEALWEQPLETGYQYHYPGNIQVLPGDEIAVAYTFNPDIDDHNAGLAKTDSLGNLIWNTFLGSTRSPRCKTVTKTYSDGDIIAGWCRDTAGLPGNIANNNPIVYKIDNLTGDIVWEYYFQKQRVRELRDITISANGDIIGCGNISLGSQKAWLFRLNGQGELLWEKNYTSALTPINIFEFEEIVESPDGSITAVAQIFLQDTLNGFPYPDGSVWLVHLDSTGCFTPDCVSDTIVITDVLEPESPEAHNAPSVFFSVAPNPSVGPMRVVFQQPLPWRQARLRVWDARGQAVQQQTLAQGAQQAQVDLADFPPGLYLIALEAEGRVWQTEKVVRVGE
jgi:outer membrane protein assembly factor BamB